MQKIAIINGPNLNLLGKRETQVYGNQSFESYFETLQSNNPTIELTYYQSNIEGELVTAIQKLGFEGYVIIINPAAYSHTSLAIADAIAAIPTYAVEVHISNIYSREEFRKHSFVSSKVQGVMTGFGLYGYQMAINFIAQKKD
jgi:3-dehydroquinate dehydratase II